jgi:ferredoxin-NADP reductase
MRAGLVGTDMVADGTAALTFEVEGGSFAFKAGQTCDLTLLSPTYEDAQGSARTFSIASSPADLPRVMFATRLTGSAFKRSLLEAKPGATIDLDGPFGSFTLHQNATKPAIFLAGGIGITPFRSIIKDAVERGLPRELRLFYSNRTLASTAFLRDLEEWAKKAPGFRLVPTLTEPAGSGTWAYETGLLDREFLARHLDARAGESIFYVAGPPGFVKAMMDVLPAVGADPDNIRAEEFAGY